MPLPNERNQQQSTGVTLPINLVRETIAYLEPQGDLKAVMLLQHYLHWLAMSGRRTRIGKRPMKD